MRHTTGEAMYVHVLHCKPAAEGKLTLTHASAVRRALLHALAQRCAAVKSTPSGWAGCVHAARSRVRSTRGWCADSWRAAILSLGSESRYVE